MFIIRVTLRVSSKKRLPEYHYKEVLAGKIDES